MTEVRTAGPRFSIVLPTYNRLPLLTDAVSSVRAQTFADLELIVVDDGSNDGTANYLQQISAEDSRIQVVSLPHIGRAAAVRNTGIAHSSGLWIAFLDSDDLWRADKLEKHLAAYGGQPRARWSYSGRTMIDTTGVPLPDADFKPWSPFSGWIAELLLTHQAMVAMPSLVAERTLLDELGGFDESLQFASDYDLTLRLASRAECIAIAEPLVSVRIHSGNMTRNRPEVDESFIRVYRKFAAANPTAATRRTCGRQIAYYAVWAARKRAASGEWWQALRHVLSAVRADPGSPEPWNLFARRFSQMRF